MDLHQLNSPTFLALFAGILANATIGSLAIPQLVDRYTRNPADPEARALTIARARRLLNVSIALQVIIACAAVDWEFRRLQIGLALYITVDTILAIRTMLQASVEKKTSALKFLCNFSPVDCSLQ